MIKGIGIDIARIQRIEKALQKWGSRFEKKILTPKEMKAKQLGKERKFAYIAGRFAAKEAIFKSLGANMGWQDIEVLSEKNGKPYVILKGRAKKIAQKKGMKQVFISLSHSDDYAIAQAIIIGDKEGNKNGYC